MIAFKGHRQGRLLPSLRYRAQAYESDPYDAPAWECDHDHGSPLEAHDCAKEWLQQNFAAETDLR